ncbi:fimbrial protein [Pantoea sp. B65]|uniref:fimbrial protein n=1 Tax=Pantoea sp. B65 TaxID=2813359 RepID=UPI0039B4D96D
MAMVVLATLSNSGQAAPQQPITLRVALSVPACEINQGQAIDVDFGNDVYTSQVNGDNYKKTIGFSLNCDSSSPTAMRLRFEGHGASFDSGVLSTTIRDLGIRLLLGSGAGAPLRLGSWVNFERSGAMPILQAVLVKRPGSTLSAGAFSGAATLVVEHV